MIFVRPHKIIMYSINKFANIKSISEFYQISGINQMIEMCVANNIEIGYENFWINKINFQKIINFNKANRPKEYKYYDNHWWNNTVEKEWSSVPLVKDNSVPKREIWLII